MGGSWSASGLAFLKNTTPRTVSHQIPNLPELGGVTVRAFRAAV